METFTQTRYGLMEYRIAEPENSPAERTLLIINGGHTHCNSPLPDEPYLLDAGFRLIVPSRPGYQGTPSTTGRTAEGAADALAALMDKLQIHQIDVIALSAGGPTGLQLASRYPQLVRSLVLQCAVTCEWPDAKQKRIASLLFRPGIERLFWAFFRGVLNAAPRFTLSKLMESLTTLDAKAIIKDLDDEQLLSMKQFVETQRSGSGFMNDIHHKSGDLSSIQARTLIVFSKYDGTIPYHHVEYAMSRIPHAELCLTEAESHLMWFSPHYRVVRSNMLDFLQKI
ncbi:alpha/beta fold hydrolase [Gorillibacterium massiliense]|uniref:alpha/beta fold hydrolase n=1 Tax=Gorillibacterium massiliense TaxID=1280390 RepID=UPI0004B12438|nr:alpha/beta hydrolase [Gorillibacterium massiliense]